MRHKVNTLITLLMIVFSSHALIAQLDAFLKVDQKDIGIKTNAPLADLHIVDDGHRASILIERIDHNNYFQLVSGTTGNGFYYAKHKQFSIVPATDKVTTYNPDQSSSLFIMGPDSGPYGGRIGFGTNQPLAKFHIVGDIKADCINAPGTNCTSDMRLKNDILLYKSGLAQILKFNPIQFQYNGLGGTKKESKHIGLIAQEVQKIAPELVQQGNATDEYDDPYLQIRESEIKYIMINAIKEQQKIIEGLEERIVALEKTNK